MTKKEFFNLLILFNILQTWKTQLMYLNVSIEIYYIELIYLNVSTEMYVSKYMHQNVLILN